MATVAGRMPEGRFDASGAVAAGAEPSATPARPNPIAIAAGPHDWGLFGPESLSWRVHSSPVLLVGGLRALLIQSLNPPAMAGIDQHSDYLERPLKRLRRTAEYLATVVYGDTPSAERAAANVRRLHTRVNGVDPITATAYSAQDLETMLWVHCVEAHSFMAAYRAYGGGLSEDEQDAYLAEQVRAAELIGIPAEIVPASRLAYGAYFEMMRDRLCVSAASREAIELVVSPPLPPRAAALPARAADDGGGRGRDHAALHAADGGDRALAASSTARRAARRGRAGSCSRRRC